MATRPRAARQRRERSQATPREALSASNGRHPHVDIAVVGSGFAGLGMGYRLRQEGIDDFVILERGEDVGGTWWWNTYPGCQCDIPSHLYSLSFAPNPHWTRTYPLQREIRDYLRRCVERFDLLPHTRFGHEVTRATWDDASGRWDIHTSRGRISARVLVGAIGGLMFAESLRTLLRQPVAQARQMFDGENVLLIRQLHQGRR